MTQKHILSLVDSVMRRFFLVIWLTFSFPVAAQLHTTFHFSVTEGLPSSEVYDVYQDKQGFLWFATDNGVARYDGKEFESFHVKDGLTDPVVFGFSEDDDGRIWFRTFSGRLCYFDGKKILPYAYNNELTKTREYGFFNFIYDSKSEELWFTLGYFLGKIDREGKTHSFPVHRPSFIIKSINGNLLRGNDIKYSVKNIVIDDEIYPIQLTDTTQNKFFNSIRCGNSIYISIYKDVFEYNQHTVKRVFTSKHPVISLSKDRENNLWLGYLNHGVEKFNDTEKKIVPEFLRNKSVTKVFQDGAAGFWFTTLESGVYYIPNFGIENYSLPSSSRLKTVLSHKDTVLLGDQVGSLFFIDSDSKKVLSSIKYENEVYSLFQDSKNNIWVSAGLDVIHYDSRFRRKNLYPNLVATSFSEGPHGSVWAFGGLRMTRFNKQGSMLISIARYNTYRAMLVDDSVIYLAGRTGFHLRDKQMTFIKAPPAFSKLKITQIESIDDTTLVFATQGNGLFLVNRKNWSYRQFDTNNQFIADNIYCLSKSDSTLWMGTEKGLIAVSIDRLLKNEAEYYQFTQRTGLVSDNIDFVLQVKGSIWAFADNGFSVIPKTFLKPTPAKPVFYIRNVLASTDTLTSQEALAATPIRLPNDKNHLTFNFGYISLSNQNIFLRYRISPESEWVITKERTLQFFSLAPGSYRLELQHSIDNIKWFPAFQGISFVINAPWWLKWYTVTGAFAFVLLLGYLYSHHRQSIYRQRNHYLSIINTHQQKLIQSEVETLERERKRIALELHDGVGTNLTAIKLMVNQLLQHYDAPQAGDVEEQFQIALRELKDIIYGLTPPSLARYGLFTALKNYVSKLNKSFKPTISIQIYGEEIKNFEFNIMVFRIVQELISNSIKHSSAENITIHINAFEDMLNIVYEDNGVGFSYHTQRAGLGLDNIESRIQSMNGTLKFDSGDHGIFYTIDIPLNTIREIAR